MKQQESMPHPKTQFQTSRAAFPDGFVFGCATAAYQIEGQGTRGRTIWDTFAATGQNVKNRDDGTLACDHLNHYVEDLDLLSALGFDAYRFSFSWPRLFVGGGKVRQAEGFDFYDRLIDQQLALGLKPFATLYHWDLPSELQDQGGWMNRDTALRFADYADEIGAHFGDRLASLATFNEPWCITYLSHMLGIHAPGYRDRRATARAMHHVPLAHGLALQALRAAGVANLGLVLNMEHAFPADDSKEALQAAHNWDTLYQGWFLEGLFKGRYPEDMVAAFGPDMPQGFEDDLPILSAPMDWLGINYYTRSRWTLGPSGDFFDLIPSPAVPSADRPLTSIGWEQHPDGLPYFLERTARDYTGDLPLYVTENGMAWEGIEDQSRLTYFDDHLAACQRALASGVPLKGYFAWSLLDNYEWAEGYEQRFGLVHVDYQTQVRTPKASAKAWRDFLKPSPLPSLA